MTASTILKEYQATYHDGTQYKIMARGGSEAVLTAQELSRSRLIRCFPMGEW